MVLLNQRVFRRCKDRHQCVFVQIFECCQNGQTANEFRDQAELQQVFWLQIGKDFTDTTFIIVPHVGAKAHGRAFAPCCDDFIQTRKSTAANEQDVGRIHLQEFLLRMLAPTLWRNGGHGAFHQLQQRLLNTLTGHVTCDGRIFRLACNFVDLIDVDDAALRPLHVVFRGLQQFQDDVFNIFANITCLGERRRIRHRERHVQNTRQGLREQRLAAARGADQQDVRLCQLNITAFLGVIEALVVVVNRNRQDTLCSGLTDHIVIQHAADILGRWHAVRGLQPAGLGFFANDIHAQLDTFVADEHSWSGNQLAHLMLALAAKAAIKRVFAVAA